MAITNKLLSRLLKSAVNKVPESIRNNPKTSAAVAAGTTYLLGRGQAPEVQTPSQITLASGQTYPENFNFAEMRARQRAETPTPTSYTGSSTMSNSDMADFGNSLASTIQEAQGSSGYPVLDLMTQQGEDRFNREGLYANDPSIPFSPSQIQAQQNAADSIYKERLSFMGDKAKAASKAGAGNIDSFLNGGDLLISALATGNIAGTSENDRLRNFQIISQLPPKQQKRIVEANVYQKLDQSTKEKYDINESVNQQVNTLSSFIDNNPDLQTNLGTYYTQKVKSVFGAGSPEYKQFQTLVGAISAQKINDLYGAAVTGAELGRADQFIPNLTEDTLETVIIKLDSLAGLGKWYHDYTIAQKLGMELPQVKDYIMPVGENKPKANTATQGTAGSAGFTW